MTYVREHTYTKVNAVCLQQRVRTFTISTNTLSSQLKSYNDWRFQCERGKHGILDWGFLCCIILRCELQRLVLLVKVCTWVLSVVSKQCQLCGHVPAHKSLYDGKFHQKMFFTVLWRKKKSPKSWMAWGQKFVLEFF